MIKKNAGELWKQIHFPGSKMLRRKYAVSNYGRTASFSEDVVSDGKLLNGSLTSGYRTLNLHVEEGNGTIYVHREVAKLFCTKTNPRQRIVIHKNHIKTDNHFKNLAWASTGEASLHQQESPQKIAYKQRQGSRSKGLKLSLAQVKLIKETLANPKRKLTYKQMAEKYGVSEMTLYRIKSGENWKTG